MLKKFFTSTAMLMLLFIWGISTAMAQSGTVQGTIVDATNGSPLPGATVQVKGTTSGTVTGLDGKYSISVSGSATLVFSYVGYQSQEISVKPNTTVNVKLKPSASNLNELVVIGYGTVKKKDATGSVTAIASKSFNKGAITSPADLLAGKVAGVQITNTGGAPGSGSVIRIRGGSSLSASNDPLIVVDGVPLANSGIAGMRSPLNTINPEDIATFTVLKDASATAIYGSRASNGVIIITTKKGRIGQPMRIDYSGKFSFYTSPRKESVFGASAFRSLIEDRYKGQNDVLKLLGNSSTDWQNQIFKNSFGTDHYVSLTGAYKTLPYRISVGYTNQDGILKTGNLKRTTLGAFLTPSFFNDHLKVTLNIQGTFVKNKFADQGAIGAATQFNPTNPIKSDSTYTVYYNKPDGTPDSTSTNYGGYYTGTQANGTPVALGPTNPVALLNLTDNHSNVSSLLGNLKLDYKFHFLPELSAHLNLAYNHSKSKGALIVPEYASWTYDPVNGGGTYNAYTQQKKNDLLDFYLNYNKDVKSIQSTFNVMAGYSWQHFYRKDYSENGNYSHTWNMDTINHPTEYYLVSFFGRFNYTFKDRYLLTFTLRDDGTSRFASNNRWGLFPSAAFAWRINEEPWLKDSKVISQLKLRLGYGITGQQNINQGNYPYLPRYTLSQNNAEYQLGNVFYRTLRPEGYNPKIKWEETTTYNLGLDYGFLQNRIYGSLDYYYRKTKDLLNFIPVPAGSNLTNYLLTNIGDLENRGFEFSISGVIISKKDLRWSLSFNASTNTNKITKLTASSNPNYLGVETGGISGGVGNNIQIHSVGYAAYSFYVYQQVYGKDGKPIEGLYVDRNGDGQITNADRYHYEDPAPKFFFGISSNLHYKNWDFSFAGRANFGNYVYNNVSSNIGVYRFLYHPEGPYLGNISTDVTKAGFYNPQYLSDYYIQNASFFRMDNITLSYLFENLNKSDKSPVNLGLSFTVNNAFVITKYTGLDPEVSNGIDNNIYPRPRVFVFGINLQF
ncbi:Outer membrane TonB-dependent transporter, utilization system for glycans and polysaccharides (PUL), SusC family [hydrothermal vent metagenome]|uniref:Outer membrane TonB-dependent transporter, utilization system for glycans and polysaccharides (PUL), SusC family n=1 Tax=hydrothermal vent metagenome TaxID=652676 RepID=A0A3B0UXK8_9ZZZZ